MTDGHDVHTARVTPRSRIAEVVSGRAAIDAVLTLFFRARRHWLHSCAPERRLA
jgi:hypothetical protein